LKQTQRANVREEFFACLKKGSLLSIVNKGKVTIETLNDIKRIDKVILYRIKIKTKQEN
jgi:hypothetical protein